MASALDSIRTDLAVVESAIVDGTWDEIDTAWEPPTVDLRAVERPEASLLLQRIEEARDEIERLRSEAASAHRSNDLLRRAGRAYVSNDTGRS